MAEKVQALQLKRLPDLDKFLYKAWDAP